MALPVTDTFKEKHFDLKEVQGLLRVSKSTALRLVKHEPGVIHIKLGPKQAKTSYVTPESVLRRIYDRMTAA